MLSCHTYLGVEPQGSLVPAPLEFPVSLLPVPARSLRLLVRGCLEGQLHQGCLLLLLGPVGNGGSSDKPVWSGAVQPPCGTGLSRGLWNIPGEGDSTAQSLHREEVFPYIHRITGLIRLEKTSEAIGSSLWQIPSLSPRPQHSMPCPFFL